MENTYMEACALSEGFAAARVVETEKIVFDPRFRPYCEENICGQYGVNYTCPPICGSPEFMKQKILQHKKTLVLESICPVKDYYDTPAIRAGKTRHNQGTLKLLKKFRAEGCPGFMVGASGCSLCSPCRLGMGEDCVFPDLKYSCMSAYCIYVKDLAEKCGMDYTPGAGKISFFGMYVFD